MAKFVLDFGVELDLLTKDELDASLRSHGDALIAGAVRGIGYKRLPQISGAAAGGVLLLGADVPVVGPPAGMAWSLRRVYISGLTAGATPDVVALYRNGTAGQPVWQISGASPQETFGRLEAVWLGGETIVVASVGTFAATGTITVSGELTEVPAEMLGKLA